MRINMNATMLTLNIQTPAPSSLTPRWDKVMK